MSRQKDTRVQAAAAALRDFVDEHLATSKIEMEAKLIDVFFQNPPFEPHHLHDATRMLLRSGEIVRVEASTRGGRKPPILLKADAKGRSREQSDRAARKRLLMSRYYSYVEGAKGRESSLAGPAGEIAFHTALVTANVGTHLSRLNRGRPTLESVMDQPVPVGPLDNGFVLQRLDSRGRPIGPWGVQVLVEVKNIREWIYPRTQELYQVLRKAALIQRANPTESFLPMLSCRRAHTTTNFMAKDFGFFVIDSRRQYLPSNHAFIDPQHLDEIRNELGLVDLVQGHEQENLGRLVAGLHALQRKYDVPVAVDRWKAHCANDLVVDAFEVLADQRTSNRRRDETLALLREEARSMGGRVGW